MPLSNWRRAIRAGSGPPGPILQGSPAGRNGQSSGRPGEALRGCADHDRFIVFDFGGKFDRSFNQSAYDGAERFKKETEGTVRVASIYSVGLSEMVQLEEEFGRRQPEAHLEVDYLRPEKVYEAVLSDEADIGLVSYPEPTRELDVIPWREEEMVIAAAPSHELAQRGPVVSPRDLDGQDFVSFDEELPIRKHVDRFLRDLGVEVKVVLHFDNIQMIKEALMHRVGVSIVPARILDEEVGQGRLAAIRISDASLHRPLGIIHRKKKRFHRVAQAFLGLLCEKPA